MTWHYDELLQGNSHFAYVMDGDRVICHLGHFGIMDLQSLGPAVERTCQEFREIISLHEAAEAVGENDDG